MDALIAPIMSSPRLPALLEELNEAYADEQRRRVEFLNALTDEKAEFIDGEVIFHSPARLDHLDVTHRIGTLFRVHAYQHRLGRVCVEKCLISLSRNDYEPDVVFFKAGRYPDFPPEQMRFPAPDLVVEVLSPSTEEKDRGRKYEDYALHGVEEYWIVDARKGRVEQYVLVEGSRRYHIRRILNHEGTLDSVALAGFAVPLAAIFDEDAFQREIAGAAA